jgi:hypothetical protein
LRLSLLESILKRVASFAPRIFGVPDHAGCLMSPSTPLKLESP